MSEPFHVPFDGGIRQDVDPAVAPEGLLARIVNGRQPRAGGVVPRPGTEIVDPTVSATSQAITGGPPHAAASAQRRQLLANALRAWARDESSLPSWQEVGRPARQLPIKGHWVALDSNADVDSPPHVAAMVGSVCLAFTSTAGVRIIECDKAMTQRFSSVVATRRNPRVLVVGTVFVIVYENTGNGTLYARTFDPSTLTLGTETALPATRVGATDRYDASEYDSSNFVMSFRDAAAQWRISKIAVPAFNEQAARLIAVAASAHSYERVYSTAGEGIYASFRDGAAVTGSAAFVNDAFSAHSLVAGIGTNAYQHPGFTRRNSTSVWLTFEDLSAGGTADQARCMILDNTATGTVDSATFYGMVLASTPFNGTATSFQVWLHDRTTVTGAAPFADRYTLTTVLRDATAGNYFLCPELTSDSRAALSHGAPTSGLKSTGNVARIGERYFSGILADVGTHTSVQILESEDTTTQPGAVRQIIGAAGAAAIGGGHLQEIPFGRINSAVSVTDPRGFENGFIRDPFQLALTDLGVASGVLPAGLYQVQVIYEYIDTAGRVHWSAPSASQQITTGGAGRAIRVTVGSCLLTEREVSSLSQATRIVVYCTTAGGSTFYRAATAAAFSTAVTITVDVGVATAIDTTAALLYTFGNQFANRPAPSARQVLAAHDAVWSVGLWDRRMIERSKTIIPSAPIQYTRADQFRAIAPFDVFAVAELDDQILWLGPAGLAVSAAESPNNQGNPPLSPPTVLSSTGCISPAVLRIPAGVLYQGQRGIYMVPRGGGEPEFLGSPIQEDMISVYSIAEAFEPLSGTGRMPTRAVAFGISTAAGNRTAFLDEDSLQWVSEDTVTGAALGAWPNPLGQTNSLVYMPAVMAAATAPILLQSFGTSDIDTGSATHFNTIAETGWLRPFGLLGWGYIRRVQVLLTALASSATIGVEYARDGAAYATLSASIAIPLGVQGQEWTLPGDQPCNAVRFRVTVFPQLSGDAGAILHGLSLDVDAADGIARLIPSARK